jgi:hypothetical protein
MNQALGSIEEDLHCEIMLLMYYAKLSSIYKFCKKPSSATTVGHQAQNRPAERPLRRRIDLDISFANSHFTIFLGQ